MATWATLSDVRKERNVLFNDAVNTFYLVIWLHGLLFPMEGRKEMFYLTMQSTHFIYSYMVSERGNPLLPIWATQDNVIKGAFLCCNIYVSQVCPNHNNLTLQSFNGFK